VKLTMNKIGALACPAGKGDMFVPDDDQKGLYVRVYANGVKTFIAQYQHAGRKVRMKIGDADAISLAQARAIARGIIGDASRGRDPAGERRDARIAARRASAHEALTLGALVDKWSALQLKDRRPRYAAEGPRAIRNIFAQWLATPAADLKRASIVAAMDDLTLKGSPVMARRAGEYLRTMFAWAVKRGMLETNPAAALPLTRVEPRERVLTDEELRAVWNATGSAGVYDAIVRTLILTGQRREEVAGMTWGELSPDLSVWTLPRARTKNHATHIVPLSAQARAIVETRPRRNDTDYVFAGERPGQPHKNFSRSKTGLDRASRVKDWRLHDLRRTAATGLQKLGVRLEVTEAVLNHVSGSRAGIIGVYQRHDWANEKRIALQAWGDRVQAIVEGRGMDGANNVVALRA
jgi:integrase